MLVQALIALVPCFTITFLRWVAGFWLLQLVVREKKSVRSTELIHTTMIQRKRIATHPSTQPTNQRNTQPTTPHPGFPIPDFPGCFDFDCPDYECPAELSTGRMDPRVGSGPVGSGRVGSGHEFAGFWRVGSGRVRTSGFCILLLTTDQIITCSRNRYESLILRLFYSIKLILLFHVG